MKTTTTMKRNRTRLSICKQTKKVYCKLFCWLGFFDVFLMYRERERVSVVCCIVVHSIMFYARSFYTPSLLRS